MKSEAEFKDFYEATLVQAQAGLAKKLSSLRSRSWTILFCALGLSGFIALVAAAQRANPVIAFIMPAALGIAASLIFYHAKKAPLNESFKESIIGEIVKFIDPGLGYWPKSGIDEASFSVSQIFTQQADRYRAEDLVSGRYDGVGVALSEVHAEYKTTSTDGKGHSQTHWHTIFKGVFIVADFNKDLQGCTIAVPDVAEKTLGSLVGGFLQKMNFSRSGQLVRLEDPEFEKKFAVYSDNQIEARYVLTPVIMEELKGLAQKFKSGISFSFKGGKAFIAISMSQSLFEISSSQLDSFEGLRKDFAILADSLGILEALDLKTRIWTKE